MLNKNVRLRTDSIFKKKSNMKSYVRSLLALVAIAFAFVPEFVAFEAFPNTEGSTLEA